MKDDDKQNYIKYRLEKSYEMLDASQLLIEHNQWNSAINRIYHAVFYAVTALLVRHDIHTKSHSGVKTMFFKYFIKTEKVNTEFGKL